MSLFGSRLKALRLSNGYTQQDLATKVGVHKQTISQYERGVRKPDPDMLSYFSDIFNVSSDYLLGKENVTLRLVEPIPRTCIPVLGRVAAGIPLKAITDITDYEEISPAMLKGDSEYYGLEIKGKSMEPRIREGDHIIFRAQSDAETGDIVVVMVNGEDATCKKLRKYDHGIDLISLNPVYEPMYFSNEQIEQLPVTIIGKVVELRAKL